MSKFAIPCTILDRLDSDLTLDHGLTRKSIIQGLGFRVYSPTLSSRFIFMYHACVGWKKVTPVLGIPRGHIWRVEIIGYAIMRLGCRV